MAHQIPSLGFSRGVPRKALHALLKSSNASSSTSLSTYKVYYPSVKTHWAPGSTIYDHGHFDAAAYPGGHHHVIHAKPVDKYGYRVNRLPLVASYNTTSLSTRPFVSNFIKRYSTVPERKKVAVVLSGCGVLDGTEIHEAVSVLVHLSRAGVDAKMFAPEKQHATVNHLTSNTGGEPRSVLEESARIARGKVKPLKALQSDDFSAIIFPGGYGAAKNLCNFAERGENMEVDKEVERIIKEFHEAKKPIGMLCVSPVIIAKLIQNVRVTVGNEDQDVSAAVKKLGGDVVAGGVNDVIIDSNHKVITSPAYMNTAPIHKIFDGIGQFVEVVLGQTNPEATKEAEKK